MATFESLMKGSPNGPVILPGDSKKSRMIEALQSGEMPKNDPVLEPVEIATIAKWIDQGAKFGGPNPDVPLIKLVPAIIAKQNEESKLGISTPTGKETISFAKDIAPVLVANCITCHVAQPAERTIADGIVPQLDGRRAERKSLEAGGSGH